MRLRTSASSFEDQNEARCIRVTFSRKRLRFEIPLLHPPSSSHLPPALLASGREFPHRVVLLFTLYRYNGHTKVISPSGATRNDSNAG